MREPLSGLTLGIVEHGISDGGEVLTFGEVAHLVPLLVPDHPWRPPLLRRVGPQGGAADRAGFAVGVPLLPSVIPGGEVGGRVALPLDGRPELHDLGRLREVPALGAEVGHNAGVELGGCHAAEDLRPDVGERPGVLPAGERVDFGQSLDGLPCVGLRDRSHAPLP